MNLFKESSGRYESFGELKMRFAEQFRTNITAYVNDKRELVQNVLKN